MSSVNDQPRGPVDRGTAAQDPGDLAADHEIAVVGERLLAHQFSRANDADGLGVAGGLEFAEAAGLGATGAAGAICLSST